ncbi:chemotaxis protein CheW [Citrobacter gillenii]|uniref:chemotaxis protein CheW n=1 Tax=Citrobacter gillenii TaxID=67828 RepID=UPI00311CB1E8
MSPQLEQILALNHGEKPECESVDEPQCTLVLFQLADKNFAFYGAQIREILAERPISRVPCCPPMLEGVINYRGRVESVMRLDGLIDNPVANALGKRTILIGCGERMQSGILIDRLIDVLEVVESQIHLPGDSLPPALQPIAVGVVKVGDTWFTLLDLNLVFDRYQETCGDDATR